MHLTVQRLIYLDLHPSWNIQLWYRDNNPQTTSNFTDAISIFFN